MDGSDAVAVARLLCSISWKCYENKKGNLAWLHMLSDASNTFFSSKDESRTLYRKLVTLGRKRGSATLVKTENHPPPVFGLTNLERMMRLVTPEYRIGILRAHARRYFSQADPFDVILRYKTSRVYRALFTVRTLLHKIQSGCPSRPRTGPPGGSNFLSGNRHLK